MSEDFTGHHPKPVVEYRCGDCGRTLEKTGGTFVHEPTWRDRENMLKQERLEARRARVAAAMPYKGAIKHCQASARSSNSRDPLPYPCGNKASRVVSRHPGPKGWPRTGDPDRIAVCGPHAGDEGSSRHFAHRWGQKNTGYVRHEADASALVETEYR